MKEKLSNVFKEIKNNKIIKDKILKDKVLLSLVGVVLVFTVFYFVSINKFSYAFVTNYDPNDAYKVTVDTIKKSAISYATNNPDLFKEDTTAFVRIQDLIDNNVLAANTEGNLVNPISNDVMNNNLIKLKNENNTITAELD